MRIAKYLGVRSKSLQQSSAVLVKGACMKNGLYANIHKKKERIKDQKAAGKPTESMRKPGTKGAPTAKAFAASKKTAKK
jgi:hypothetical protein